LTAAERQLGACTEEGKNMNRREVNNQKMKKRNEN
jgi:hypothetical protein